MKLDNTMVFETRRDNEGALQIYNTKLQKTGDVRHYKEIKINYKKIKGTRACIAQWDEYQQFMFELETCDKSRIIDEFVIMLNGYLGLFPTKDIKFSDKDKLLFTLNPVDLFDFQKFK